jgi:hypothetical protein
MIDHRLSALESADGSQIPAFAGLRWLRCTRIVKDRNCTQKQLDATYECESRNLGVRESADSRTGKWLGLLPRRRERLSSHRCYALAD